MAEYDQLIVLRMWAQMGQTSEWFAIRLLSGVTNDTKEKIPHLECYTDYKVWI